MTPIHLDIGYGSNRRNPFACDDLQEYIIGDNLSFVTDTWKISDRCNSEEESKTNNELVCIGELMWDGYSGVHLRGKYESN